MIDYSQFGEQTLIANLLREIGEKNRWCFEVGAADGRFLSNTLHFREQGWNAVLAESRVEEFLKLSKDFPDANAYLGEVTDMDWLLEHFGAPKDIDLGVIDIDGQDYWLWHDMVRYRPRIMLIEFNPYNGAKGYHPTKIVERGKPGQTAKTPIVNLATAKGYELRGETFCNLLFVDRDCPIRRFGHR